MSKEGTSLAVFCTCLLYLASVKYANLFYKTLRNIIKRKFTSYLYFISNNFTVPEEDVLLAIDEILWLLKDGKWHNITEIIEKCSSPKPKAKMAVSFLWEYDFIELNENGRKAKLRPLTLNFIDEIQRVEREEALSHKSFEGAVGVEEFESLSRSFKKI